MVVHLSVSDCQTQVDDYDTLIIFNATIKFVWIEKVFQN